MALEIPTLTNQIVTVVGIDNNKSISHHNWVVRTSNMIKKQLEKTLKDAIKEDAYIIGTKQVLGNISKSKLVLLSKSVPSHIIEKIHDDATKSKISTISYDDTSVNLGKLCGLQFRVSALSLTNIADTDIKSLQKETESKWCC